MSIHNVAICVLPSCPRDDVGRNDCRRTEQKEREEVEQHDESVRQFKGIKGVCIDAPLSQLVSNLYQEGTTGLLGRSYPLGQLSFREHRAGRSCAGAFGLYDYMTMHHHSLYHGGTPARKLLQLQLLDVFIDRCPLLYFL